MPDSKKLKIGYTTGSHAASALKAALLAYFKDEVYINAIKINFPDGSIVDLEIKSINKTDDYVKVSVIKSDNDDIDVTKGCEITCWVGLDVNKIPYTPHNIEHNPYRFELGHTIVKIWAAKGLGIVTKPGLKPPVEFPAINPVPLEMMKLVCEEVLGDEKFDGILNILFEVKDGEQIAINTANKKVGIVHGISFLGKKGIVKPISTNEYLSSLEEEVSVASQNKSKTIVLTIGNSSLEFAKVYYPLDEECFVEIGNFIYDSISIIKHFEFNKIILVSTIGKLTKIAQNKQNTNNRFGEIDFNIIRQWLEQEYINDNIVSYCGTVSTLSDLENYIIKEFPSNISKLYGLLVNKAVTTIQNWCNELDITNTCFEVILTDGKSLNASEKLQI